MKRPLSLLSILFHHWAFFSSCGFADQFILDSPEPLPYKHVWVDIHSSFTHLKSGTAASLPGVESYMGIYPDFQTYSVWPVTLSAPRQKSTRYGYGDVRLGLKYRFIHETETCPQVAFYPKFTFPSGDPDQGIGNRKTIGTVPLWMQKKWGDWKFTGGASYVINPAKGKFNYLYGGMLIRWQITKSFMLGNEFVLQEPKSLTDGSKVLYNFGGSYYFTPQTFVLFSTGHSIYGTRTFIGFVGFGMKWGPG